MSTTPRLVLLLPALAALVVGIAGCTSAVSGTAAPAGQSPATAAGDPVQWVDGVCGALLPFVKTAGTPPQLNTASDPTALAKGISDYLGQGATAADSAISGIAAVGPSPVAGGDDVITRLTQTLTTFRTSFQDAKTQVDAVDTTNPQSLRTDLPKAVAPLEQLANMPDPTVDLQTSPELERASSQAPNCQQVERQTGG